MADTRGDTNAQVIDTAVLTPIVDRILAMTPAPKVVIFGGDAAYRGGTTNLTTFENVFTNRLTAADIPSAFAVGNHELYTTHDYPQYLMRQQDFQAMFNSNWPQNGPPGYNNLAFSFHIGNSLFIIADSFYATSNTTEPSYGISAAQQDWMKGLLQNNTASHTFVFTHVPAFSPWVPSPVSEMANTWQTITTSGNATNTNTSILFTGHEHLYYRTLRDSTGGYPDPVSIPATGTYQVLAGSAGAVMTCDPLVCGGQVIGDVYALSYNYAAVSINGRYVTVSVSGFDLTLGFASLDVFSFFDNSGVNNSVINNTAPIVGPQPAGILAGSGNTINNSAPISNVATGIDAVSNNTITNSASIKPSSSGNGIYVYDNNKITNTVTGSITGNSTDLWGIHVRTGNTVVNNGTVAVSGTNSIAFLAQGDSSDLPNGDSNTITNYGTLSASGTNSYAVKFLGKGNTLVNSGTILGSGGPAIDFSQSSSDSLKLLPGSKVIGAINLGTGDTVNFRGGNHNLTFNSLTGATVTGTTPFAAPGNQAAAIDPTPFAMTDHTLMDFTRGISSVLGDRFSDMVAVQSSPAMTFAPQSNVAMQADDAFAGIPGLSAYASDAILFKNPTAQYSDGTAVWARGFTGQRVQQADGVLLHTLNQFYGGMIGGDWQAQSNLRLGVFLGAGKTRSTVDLNSGDSDSDLVFGGVFGRYVWGASFLSVVLQGGHSHTSTTRNINNNLAPAGLESATATYDGWYISPEATVGHHFALGSLAGASYTLTPSLQVRYLYGSFGGYTESGSTANLTVGRRAVANFEERGQLKLTRTQVFAPTEMLMTSVYGGVLGDQRVGSTTVDAALLGQAIPFATPGKDNVGGGFGGLGLEVRTGSVSLFASAECLALSDASSVVSGKGGIRVAF